MGEQALRPIDYTPTELIEFLVGNNILSQQQVEDAQRSHTNISAIKTLISTGVLDELVLAELLGKAFSLPVQRLTSIDPQAARLLPLDIIRQIQCVPFKVEKSSVSIAVADPTKIIDLKSHLMRPINPVITTFSNLEAAIKIISAAPAEISKASSAPPAFEPPRPPGQSSTSKSQKRLYPVKTFSAKDQVTAIFNDILGEAVAKGASDVHIEPQANAIRVRFRIEGQLVDLFQVPAELKDQLTSRIKIVGGMDISERKIPQDGRLKIQTGKADCSFRINTMPSMHGESIAIRVLKPGSGSLDLSKIGFSNEQLISFR